MIIILSTLLLISSYCITAHNDAERSLADINNFNDVVRVFSNPLNKDNVNHRIEHVQRTIATVITIDNDARTFANTIEPIAQVLARRGDCAVSKMVHSTVELLLPDADARSQSVELGIHLKNCLIAGENNQQLHQAIEYYAEHNMHSEELTQEQQDTVQSLIKRFNKNKKAEEKDIALKQEINSLERQFVKNISTVGPIKPLHKCHDAQKRKNIFCAFNAAIHAKNEYIIHQLYAHKNELAHRAGFDHYAAQVLRRPESLSLKEVELFLQDVSEKSQKYNAALFESLKDTWPESVTLHDGKMLPWDTAYTIAQFKKGISNRANHDCFPLHECTQNALNVMANTLGYTVRMVPTENRLWHKDVTAYEISDNETNTVVGYLLLDILARSGKPANNGYTVCIVPPAVIDGKQQPGVFVGVSNLTLPKSPAKIASHSSSEEIEDDDNDKQLFCSQSFLKNVIQKLAISLNALLATSAQKKELSSSTVNILPALFTHLMHNENIVRMITNGTSAQISDDVYRELCTQDPFGKIYTISLTLLYAYLGLELSKGVGQKTALKEIYEKHFPVLAYAPECHLPSTSICFSQDTPAPPPALYLLLYTAIVGADVYHEATKQGALDTDLLQQCCKEVFAKNSTVTDLHDSFTTFFGREPSSDALFKHLGT